MSRNKNFIQMCLSKIFGERPHIKYLSIIEPLPLVKLSSFFILKYIVCTPNFISLLIVDMMDII